MTTYRRYPVEVTQDPTIGQVVNKMCQLIWEGHNDLDVRHHATSITGQLHSGNYIEDGKAILRAWSPPNKRYVKDPVGNEWLQGLKESMQSNGMDCDDFTIAICAEMMSLGHQMELCLASFDGLSPSHVFAIMKTPKGRMVLDPVAGNNTAGMLRDIKAFTIIPVEEGLDQQLSGTLLDADFRGWNGWRR